MDRLKKWRDEWEKAKENVMKKELEIQEYNEIARRQLAALEWEAIDARKQYYLMEEMLEEMKNEKRD